MIEFLKAGWTRPQLLALFAAAGLTPREALRTTKSPAENLSLLSPEVSDAVLLEAMLSHPILVNRPIVACKTGVKLSRSCGAVLDLLPTWPQGPWLKEKGDLLIDAAGNRLPE